MPGGPYSHDLKKKRKRKEYLPIYVSGQYWLNGEGEEFWSPSQWSNSIGAGLCALIVEADLQCENQKKEIQ